MREISFVNAMQLLKDGCIIEASNLTEAKLYNCKYNITKLIRKYSTGKQYVFTLGFLGTCDRWYC